ncbi:hypothetical protein F5J12DRAFT_912535 [Pisolithus orientalis]|uniref:uncharacterized protein n=1 Tax=Pisolithus orientalis TaxID=936130 RepID=UPI0022245186|nr:uncharacterized protein F5J12DRAFT_912535 [Pisolithus orientalis]KAI6008732.1 hypothetical protein F5J12DRAFT_912535 [Pisolithus orientalis]
MDRLGSIEFPSLKRVEFELKVKAFPNFLSATNVPVLEELKVSILHHNLRSPLSVFYSEILWLWTVSGLTTPQVRHFKNSVLIPVLTLVSLSLSGYKPPRLLHPNSVHFPVLEVLEIKLGDADDFFKAIATPKLKFLDYTVGSENPLPTCSSLGNMLNSVNHVSHDV